MSRKVYILKRTRFSNESVYYWPMNNIAVFETEEDVREELDRIAEEERNKDYGKEMVSDWNVQNYGDRVTVEFMKDKILARRWGYIYEYDVVDFYEKGEAPET